MIKGEEGITFRFQGAYEEGFTNATMGQVPEIYSEINQ